MARVGFKVFATIGLLLVFYNEFVVYWISYLNWPQLHKSEQFYYKNGTRKDDLDERPLRLLVVADPQLIGENDEPFFQSWIARWDSDRYLRSSFILANAYTQPDAIIYLGDLFDEGLKSSDEQYARYFDRFRRVFQLDKRNTGKVKNIFLSGDNDIGGEYFGDRTERLEDRYERFFGPLVEVIRMNKYTEFVKLDLDKTVSFYNRVKRGYVLHLLNENATNQYDQKYTVVLNHQSLVDKSPEELNAINEDTNAGLIIKADSHKFSISKYSYLVNRVVEHLTYQKNPSNYYILTMQPNKPNSRIQTVYEVSLPTCSYRMGVPEMGYGLVTLSPKGKAYVSILWLPSRFASLALYRYLIYVIWIYLLYAHAFRRFFRSLFRIFLTKIDSIVI